MILESIIMAMATIGANVIPVEESPLQPSIVEATHVSTISGASMEPWFRNGQKVIIHKRQPEIDDAVAFRCFKDLCEDGQDDNAVLKFLKKKEVVDGETCYWFEGRPDRYIFEGVEYGSFDSTRYGWVCDKEIKIYGVIERVCSSLPTTLETGSMKE
jgi:hypothetical protein